MKLLRVGDTVMMSRHWLQSVGLLSGPVPFARGIVESVEKWKTGPCIVTVAWDTDGMPARVLHVNLVRKDRIQFELH